MKRKKFFTCVGTLLVAIALVFAACSHDSDTFSPPMEEPPEEEQEVQEEVQEPDPTDAKVPIIITHPMGARAVVPASLTLTAGGYAEDGGAIIYQWHSVTGADESHEIEGATESTYTAEVSQFGKIGYFCVITNIIEDNGDGGVKSASARTETAWIEAVSLGDVLEAPVFTQQPARYSLLAVGEGTSLTGRAEVANYGAVYRWFETDGFDSKPRTAVTGGWSSSPDFEVAPFAEEGIRYFVCAALSYVPSDDSGDRIPERAVVSDVAAVAYTGLPVMRIDTVGALMPSSAKEKHDGTLRLIKDGVTVYDSTDDNEPITIKVRGNATAGYPKKPYKIKLPKKANLLAAAPRNASDNKDKHWVLLAGYCDKTLLRTATGFYAASLFNGIPENGTLYVPHAAFVDLVMNGEYLGTYFLADSVKEGDDRLAVNEKDKDNGGIGFVAEYDPAYYRNEADWFISDRGNPYTFKFPDPEDYTGGNFSVHKDYLNRYINDFEKALYSEESEHDWQDYIDTESFARWFLAHNLTANKDTNYFFSKKTSDDTSKLVMGPVWDFEWSIGIGWMQTTSRPVPANYWCVNGWYFAELLKKREFVEEVKRQWNALKMTCPDIATAINTRMDEMSRTISLSRQLNFMRWDIMNQFVGVGGIPLGSYEAELECDKQFMRSRVQWLDSAINGL